MPALAPLDPDRFLAWTWARHHGKGRPWTVAEWAAFHWLDLDAARHDLLRQAVWTRREQRLGRLRDYEPLSGADAASAEIRPRDPEEARRWLSTRPASFWPQMRSPGGPSLNHPLPTVEEWTAELDAEFEAEKEKK